MLYNTPKQFAEFILELIENKDADGIGDSTIIADIIDECTAVVNEEIPNEEDRKDLPWDYK